MTHISPRYGGMFLPEAKKFRLWVSLIYMNSIIKSKELLRINFTLEINTFFFE
mgnify:FL=1